MLFQKKMSLIAGGYFAEEIKKKEQDLVLKEFKKYDFSYEITSEARKIWTEIDVGTKKKKRRSMLFFFCFYIAHIRLKVVQDHEYIAEKVGISEKEAIRSFIEFSETKTKFKVPLVEFKIIDFLNLYISRLDLDEDFDDIIKIYNDLLRCKDSHKKRSLFRTKPQNVATAILDYYKGQKYARMKKDEFSLLYKKKETINTVRTHLIELLHDN